MKNILVMLVAVGLMAGGCTSRTYVNRGGSPPPRYSHNHRDRNYNYNHGPNDRYDRRYDNRGW